MRSFWGLGGPIRRPLEQRDLFLDKSGVAQGCIEMWVEIFTASMAPRYPLVNIEPPAKEKYELRVVVWNAEDLLALDSIGMNACSGVK